MSIQLFHVEGTAPGRGSVDEVSNVETYGTYAHLIQSLVALIELEYNFSQIDDYKVAIMAHSAYASGTDDNGKDFHLSFHPVDDSELEEEQLPSDYVPHHKHAPHEDNPFGGDDGIDLE